MTAHYVEMCYCWYAHFFDQCRTCRIHERLLLVRYGIGPRSFAVVSLFASTQLQRLIRSVDQCCNHQRQRVITGDRPYRLEQSAVARERGHEVVQLVEALRCKPVINKISFHAQGSKQCESPPQIGKNHAYFRANATLAQSATALYMKDTYHMAVPKLRRIEFEPGSSHLEFVMDKTALGHVLSKYFCFPCESIVPLSSRAGTRRPISGLSNSGLDSNPAQ